MDAITHDLEIWLICSTAWLAKIFQNLFVQMFDIMFTANQNFHNIFPMGKPYKYSVLPELVMEPNHTCLLLIPLLLPIIIWLAEMLILLRKNPLLTFSCFSGFSSTWTYYSLCSIPYINFLHNCICPINCLYGSYSTVSS